MDLTSLIAARFAALLELPRVVEDLQGRLSRLERDLETLQAGDPEQLLPADQAAQLLGTSERALRQAAWRGRIPAIRAKGRLRFRRGDLLPRRNK